jgi:DNA mismatch endonuclease, patch repair protein
VADRVTPEQRSAVMRRIRSKDSKAELALRRALHRLGYRFRLHASDLKGKPDVIFRPRQAAIFMHGCYWHGHGCRVAGAPPKSNVHYWGPKIERNVARDGTTRAALEELGWRVLVVWECEVSAPDLDDRLSEFLGPRRMS